MGERDPLGTFQLLDERPEHFLLHSFGVIHDLRSLHLCNANTKSMYFPRHDLFTHHERRNELPSWSIFKLPDDHSVTANMRPDHMLHTACDLKLIN